MIPERFVLEQNYPNPFNPRTSIRFQVSGLGFVSLKVYDVLGREVRTLVNEAKSPGRYQVEFDAGDLSSGIYFYRMRVAGGQPFIATKKLVLMK
jgi:hypothetical protein